MCYPSHVTLFTFHYVSIKSYPRRSQSPVEVHLHSTMYLLNRKTNPKKYQWYFYLHSTMYLLNPRYNTALQVPVPIYIPLCIY